MTRTLPVPLVPRQHDQTGKRFFVVLILPRGIGFEALDIDPERRPGRAGARKAIDDAAAVLEMKTDTLVLRVRAVHRIVISEIIVSSNVEP